ncbi:MucBP domain-containing protein [Companilactobacillus mishanensis]|uniref:MucBP domain-containing protein n=1 Tax=Companilactobacillus mishanensis TaxID=2486008 RepID=UPI001297A67B|nr:SLAP domain-containing protein [Companilactobacillus mishanensis]MQS89947.1 hypothetical protein [Companilactobacillus mishanensis]
MKKRNIFVSTMLCGVVMSSVITPSVVQGAAVLDSGEVGNQENLVVTNKIQFRNNNGSKFSESIIQITGKIGQTILPDQIKVPNGYEISDVSNLGTLMEDSEYVHNIVIEPIEKSRIVKFVESRTNKIISEKIIRGKIGEQIRLNEKMLMKGYRFKSSNIVTISDKKEIECLVVNKANLIEKEIQFVTSNNEIIGSPKYYYGEDGEYIKVSTDDIPLGYQLTRDETKIHFDRNSFIQKILVEPKQVSVSIDFVDIDTKEVISEKKNVTGVVNSRLLLDLKDIKNGYEYVNQEQILLNHEYTKTWIFVQPNRDNYVVYVQRKLNTNRVIMETRLGNKVGEFVARGKEGKTKIEIPEYLNFKGIDDTYIAKDKSVVYLKVKNLYVKKRLSFVTPEGLEVESLDFSKLKVDNFQRIDIASILEGYELSSSNPDFKGFNVDDDGESVIEVQVIAKTISKKIKIVDYKNKNKCFGEIIVSGKMGEYIEIPSNKIPAGYARVARDIFGNYDEEEQTIYVSKWIMNFVQFVSANGELVQENSIYGTIRDKVKISVPEGYTLISSKDELLHMLRDRSINIVLVRPIHNPINSNSNNNFPSSQESIKDNQKKETTITNVKMVISTHLDMVTDVFNIKGKHTGRNLDNNTDWVVDKKAMINGELYYRVSTSEWIKAAHVFEYKNKIQTVITKHGDVSSLYNSRGEKIRARSLANNTGWYSDRTAMINGKLHYRVSTAEWLSVEDVQ